MTPAQKAEAMRLLAEFKAQQYIEDRVDALSAMLTILINDIQVTTNGTTQSGSTGSTGSTGINVGVTIKP